MIGMSARMRVAAAGRAMRTVGGAARRGEDRALAAARRKPSLNVTRTRARRECASRPGAHRGRDRRARGAALTRRAARALTDIALYLPFVTLYRPLIARSTREGPSLCFKTLGAGHEP
jgi:hypothetical protein